MNQVQFKTVVLRDSATVFIGSRAAADVDIKLGQKRWRRPWRGVILAILSSERENDVLTQGYHLKFYVYAHHVIVMISTDLATFVMASFGLKIGDLIV